MGALEWLSYLIRIILVTIPLIGTPFLVSWGEDDLLDRRQLCNRYLRQFVNALSQTPYSPNVDRARILGARASLLCRQGRHGEAQYLLQGALMGIRQQPEPDRLIQEGIERRTQTEDRRLRDIEELKALNPSSPP